MNWEYLIVPAIILILVVLGSRLKTNAILARLLEDQVLYLVQRRVTLVTTGEGVGRIMSIDRTNERHAGKNELKVTGTLITDTGTKYSVLVEAYLDDSGPDHAQDTKTIRYLGALKGVTDRQFCKYFFNREIERALKRVSWNLLTKTINEADLAAVLCRPFTLKLDSIYSNASSRFNERDAVIDDFIIKLNRNKKAV